MRITIRYILLNSYKFQKSILHLTMKKTKIFFQYNSHKAPLESQKCFFNHRNRKTNVLNQP